MIEITNPTELDLWREDRELKKNQNEYWGDNDVEVCL